MSESPACVYVLQLRRTSSPSANQTSSARSPLVHARADARAELASLGACAAFYAVDYFKRQKMAVEGTKVRVTAEKAKNPARLDPFRIEVVVPVELSAEQVQGLEEAVHRCLIHNTMLHPPKIELAVRSSAVEEG